jgi:hypothetical protein
LPAFVKKIAYSPVKLPGTGEPAFAQKLAGRVFCVPEQAFIVFVSNKFRDSGKGKSAGKVKAGELFLQALRGKAKIAQEVSLAVIIVIRTEQGTHSNSLYSSSKSKLHPCSFDLSAAAEA